MVSLAWVGNCEIRMHDVSSAGAAKETLFKMDYFDHDSELAIENRLCHDVEEGAAAFEAFEMR
jgi:hypothetical protein